MWYEILPSFTIITVCLIAPQALSFAANKLLLNNVSIERGSVRGSVT